MLLTVTLIIIGVLAVGLIVIYNSLVTARVRVDEAWSDITVQLKRRYDLIPNVVEAVKGYAKHEKELLQRVTEARANAIDAKGIEQKAEAENMLAGALKSLFAVAEAYPDLKANQNFLHLQEELVDSEDKIQAARRFYNGGVRDLNQKIQIFPNNLVAGLLGFTNRDFFEVENQTEVEKPVEVKF
jgi:LemA protein